MKTQTFFGGAQGWSVFNKSLAVLGMLIFGGHANAQDVTLANGGSSVTFNLGGGSSGPIGINNWTVDSDPAVSQLNQQWFWFSINGTVQSIDQIGTGAQISNYTPGGSTLTATYQNSTLAVILSYTLTGDGSGSGGGDLSESVNILNLTSGNLNINFYQYANFNLLQNNMNSVTIVPATGGGYSFVSQSTTVGGNGIQETLSQPYANFAETGAPTGVQHDVTAGHTLNDTTYASGGNVAWALEWSDSVSPFDPTDGANTWDVLQDQNMSILPVPEPTSITWVVLGMGIVGLVRRSWKRDV